MVKLPRVVPTHAIYLTSPEGPQPFVVKLKSRGRHEIHVYIFVPPTIEPSQADQIPVVIDAHGGGFFLGSCLEQAPFCSKMARELGAVVLSVDYRLGPNDKFPAAVEDMEDVLSAVLDESSRAYNQLRIAIRRKILENWEHENKKAKKHNKHDPEWTSVCQIDHYDLDRTRIAISGFSSGGNLALNLAISTTDPDTEEPSPSIFPLDYAYQIPVILYYPAVDLRQLPSERTRPPNLPVSSGFWSEVNDMLAPTYLPRDKTTHPRASPGLVNVEKCLHPMARVQLVVPELDDLADQNEIWAKKVQDSGRGGDLVVERYANTQHGWTQMPDQMLDKEQRRTKEDIYDKTVLFTRFVWEGNEIPEAFSEKTRLRRF